MADDNNVTDLPEQQQKGSPRPKSPEAIMNEIKASFLKQKAEALKQKMQAKMAELDKLKSSTAICEAELAKMIEEYQAETSI